MTAITPSPVLLSYADYAVANPTPKAIWLSLGCGFAGLALALPFAPALLPDIFNSRLIDRIEESELLSTVAWVQLALACAGLFLAGAGRHTAGRGPASKYLLALTTSLVVVVLFACEAKTVGVTKSKVLCRWTSISSTF